jgi:Methionine biosynthesis protein MetW
LHAASLQRIDAIVPEGALVLDVGGWASPMARADWVIDLMPYETRGLYGPVDAASERFSAETWIVRDICDREPWPFSDRQFDFAVCSHTLEDVRDPIWVCAELNRVARAGYVETPSRLEEQSQGVAGPFVGWSHHHWLVDETGQGLRFVLKPHMIHARPEFTVSSEEAAQLTADERVLIHFWDGELAASERVFFDSEQHDAYLAEPVLAHRQQLAERVRASGPGRTRRVVSRLRNR